MMEHLEKLTGEEEFGSWIVQGTEEGPSPWTFSQSPSAAAESKTSRLGGLGGQAEEQRPAPAAKKFQISCQEPLSRCATASTAKRPPMETMESPPAILRLGQQHTCNGLDVFHPAQRQGEDGNILGWSYFSLIILFKELSFSRCNLKIQHFFPSERIIFFFCCICFFTLNLKFQ